MENNQLSQEVNSDQTPEDFTISQGPANTSNTYQASPTQNSEFPKFKLFVLILSVILLVTLLALGKFNKNSKSINTSTSSPTSSLTPKENGNNTEEDINLLTSSTPVPLQSDIEWTEYTDEERVFSFEIPKGWNFVSGRGDKGVDFDILSPNKEMFVGIYVGTDERVLKGMRLTPGFWKGRKKQNPMKLIN